MKIKENIYKIILDHQGPKHPRLNYQALDGFADYLVRELGAMSFVVEEQVFYVHGDSRPYRNILGFLGDYHEKYTLIGAHYDTVENTPGANDNLSAVAVSLELARLLSNQDIKSDLCFAFFSLEEGHPSYFNEKYQLLKDNNYIDINGNFTDVEIFEFSKDIEKKLKNRDKSIAYYKSLENYLESNSFSESQEKYLKLKIQIDKKYTDISPINKASYPVGSYKFVKKYGEFVDQAYIFDCLGWIRSETCSQKPLPLPKEAQAFMNNHLVSGETNVGNFLAVIGDINSHELLNLFQKNIVDFKEEIPNISLKLPFAYEVIRKMFPDVLRSDHALFWKENIPSLFITDTANFRSQVYHTPADSHEKINYKALEHFTIFMYDHLKSTLS